MRGTTVFLFFIITIALFYLTGYLFKFDYLKFWPRVILGIIGTVFMLLMHVYSIRKRSVKFFLFKIFPYKLPVYLNIHIILATAGVALIIIHAIGSYDSIVAWLAFFSMFMVWQSGFVGRYIFIKIPKDNNGIVVEKENIMERLENLNNDFIKQMKANHEDKEFQDFLVNYLGGYGKTLQLLHKKSDTALIRFFKNFGNLFKAWKIYKDSINLLESEGIKWIEKAAEDRKGDKKEVYLKHLQQYDAQMKNLLLLNFQMEFFDILKSLFKNWHDIHVPLTYLFYTCAIMHIFLIIIFSFYAH